ncbi:uncharacterized protein PV09_09380 [Verruconis gallopava]|uniref:Uncharacterized protein n=1 Tax=Verruconis gallopava TaxID=253628 RepID=A0A0D1YDN8_9PEZI|nr:uncharacterized protein PV09_09380 [Verruconis gallopava]KIV98851.1 hypothetical protein PV09_09380 [Verruconis gallopava]
MRIASLSSLPACAMVSWRINGSSLRRIGSVRTIHQKKTGCRISCIGKEQSDRRWRLTIREGEYNHRPAPVGTYAAHRKRETPVKERIMQDLWAGCAVRQTHAQLQQQFPNILITKQDIFNKRVQAKARALQGRSVVEALFSELEDSGYYYPHQTFPENHEKAGTLSHLLVIHPRSLAIYKATSLTVSQASQLIQQSPRTENSEVVAAVEEAQESREAPNAAETPQITCYICRGYDHQASECTKYRIFH